MNEGNEGAPEQAKAATAGQGEKLAGEYLKDISDLEKKVKEAENKYLYLYAEFDNFKKRAIKERSDLLKFGWENAARELLQTADNLARALEHVPAGTDAKLVDGLKMVLGQFEATLKKQGVEQVSSLNQTFDPNLHEAIGQEPAEAPAGTIVKEHTKGYTLHGRLLRPARVVLSAGKNQAS